MSSVKGGWEVNTWQNVLEVRSGRNQKEVLDPDGEYPIMGSAGKIMGYANDFLCDEGTTIIGRKGTIDKPLFIETKFWNVDTAFGLIAGENLEKRFLFYFCKSFDFQTLNKGTTLPSLVKKDLVKISIPIPPLAEQKQIVALLDQAFAAIDQAKANLEKNIQNAQELFQSKLNAIFSQSGEGWVEKRLGDVISITHGYAFKSQNFITDYNGKNPIVLTPGNFSEDSRLYFTQKNTKRCISDFPEEYKFNEGELVIVMTDLSSKMKILGKPAVIDSSNILHNQRIGRVIFNTDEIERDMLYYFFQSDDYLLAIKSTATGTMVRHTAPKRILANKVSFPTSNEQQKKIINALNNIRIYKEKVVMNYQTKLNNLEELKKSILQKAFNGEIT